LAAAATPSGDGQQGPHQGQRGPEEGQRGPEEGQREDQEVRKQVCRVEEADGPNFEVKEGAELNFEQINYRTQPCFFLF
jgi:hypothetical protein